MSYDKLVAALRETDSSDWKRLSLDAAAAIEELQAEVKDAVNEGYNAGYTAGIGYCSFKRTKRQHWVSVEERLPEKVGSYLTAYYDGFVCENQWHYTGTTAIGWINDGEAVRYWMPLPAPPKEAGRCEK